MKFGLFFLLSFDADVHRDAATLYEQILEQAVLAEDLGFDAVWAAEHHFDIYDGYVPNPCVLLAAIAQRTRRIRLGTASVALPLNRPLNTAEQLAMVDALSGGRVDIGVVRAFLHFEYEALNVDMNESRERFNEGLDIIRGTWANERFSYDGKYNRFDNVRLTPRPVQTHPRIVIGSVMSPESIIYAGRNGFDLMVIAYAVSLEKVREIISLYHEALDEGGHDPADHPVMSPLHCYVHENEKMGRDTVREPMRSYIASFRDCVKADKWSKDYKGYEGLADKVEALMDFEVMYDKHSLFGDPAHAHECMEAVIDAGIGEISLVSLMPGLAQDKILDSLRLFAAEVMPRYAIPAVTDREQVQ